MFRCPDLGKLSIYWLRPVDPQVHHHSRPSELDVTPRPSQAKPSQKIPSQNPCCSREYSCTSLNHYEKRSLYLCSRTDPRHAFLRIQASTLCRDAGGEGSQSPELQDIFQCAVQLVEFYVHCAGADSKKLSHENLSEWQ